MCRKNQLLGLVLIGASAGLFVGCRVDSVFWCSCLALGTLIVGIALLQKTKA